MPRSRERSRLSKPKASLGLELIHTFSGEIAGWIASIAFSPDGSKLSVGTQFGGLQVWSTDEAKLVFEVHVPTYHVHSAEWSPDGELIATSHDGPQVRIWDVGKGKLAREVLVIGEDEVKAADARAILLSRSVRALERRMQALKTKRMRAVEKRMQALKRRNGSTKKRSKNKNEGTDFWPFRYSNVSVRSAAWSPDGRLFATADDFGVRLWDGKSFELIHMFREVSDAISIRWAPDGKQLATTSYRGGVHIFDVETLLLSIRLESTYGAALAWTPDGSRIASSCDNAICTWDTKSGRLLNALEAHSVRPRALCFSPDGKLLASRAGSTVGEQTGADNQTILWRTDSWEICGTIREKADWYLYTGLAFSPDGTLLASCGDRDRAVRLWRMDISKLLTAEPPLQSVYYKNAKAALLGDSGVGKSGLELVLTNRPYTATDSTHGRRVSVLSSKRTVLSRKRQEIREIILWDLAGQPGYRLIHQLHLDDVSLGLLVFDSRSELDPFAGLRHWNRALLLATHGSSSSPTRILVAARTDRGPLGVSKQRVEAIKSELCAKSYVETSAKDGKGIAELQSLIENSIDWSTLPTVTSNVLLQAMRAFLARERKKKTKVLATVDELRKGFLNSHAGHYRDTEALQHDFVTCLSRLQALGLLRRFSFGNLVLLQPEVLDAYASSIIFAAKQEPDGMGAISEDDVRAARFPMSRADRLADANDEKLLILATIEDLIRHELALREPSNDSQLLVFPSQLTRENPELPDPPGKEIYFELQGALLNIYATLIVRLSHSGFFANKEMWKNAVSFAVPGGGSCGLYLTEIDEARGTIALFFSTDTPQQIKNQLDDYVHSHLLRRALPNTVARRIVVRCPKCSTTFTQQMIEKRMELGFDWASCSVCGTSTNFKPPAVVPLTPSITTRDIDVAAVRRKNADAALVAASAEMQTGSFRSWAGADRTTLALVFTDMVGSTLLGEELGDEGMAGVRHAHFQNARRLIAHYKGYEIKTVGDSFMVAFRTAVQALNFALELHHSPGDELVQIRAGIHVGPVHVEEEDAFGNMVNYAARVVGSAKGAEVWVSDRAHSDILAEKSRSHKRIRWTKHPGCDLKGFRGKHNLWSLTA